MEDVVIIGAGPYGLSIAAYLLQNSLKIRVFGIPMASWRYHMPANMHLKSEGFASSLYSPGGTYQLARFCEERGISYAAVDLPVARQTFADYGQEFARRFVPMLEECAVTDIRRGAHGFDVVLDHGGVVATRQVVLATGIMHHAHIPPVLRELPPALISHASAHHDFTKFSGKTIAVIGGGASATDCAADLSQSGANTHLATRRQRIDFHAPPRRRTIYDQCRAPRSKIGPSWKSVLCTQAPLLFHTMPEAFRLEVTRRYLGPSACWFVEHRIRDSVTMHTNVMVHSTASRDGRAALSFAPGDAGLLEFDHVIAATGYKIDLSRLSFLGKTLRGAIRTAAGAPVLTRFFESSVSGLFFVGPSAANAFGPLLRFACGAEFAARRLAKRLS